MNMDMTDEEWDQIEREMDEEDRLREEAKSPEQKAKEAAAREARRIYFETGEQRRKFAMQKLRQFRAADVWEKQKIVKDYP